MNKEMALIELLQDLFDYRDTMPYKLPKKIEFNDTEFTFKDKSYYDCFGQNIMVYVDHTLDLRVMCKILNEENDEFEDIVELIEFDFVNFKNMSPEKRFQATMDEYGVINQLIRNQMKIIEKIKEYDNN